MAHDTTQVVIAGGGPVGMTLALELAHHGVHSILLERNASTTRHPKMDLTNGRSMEHFRRLGVVQALRAAGVPPSEPHDVVWATSATGYVLHRFAYPSADGYRDRVRVCNDGTGTLEPSMRVSQIVLEPVLKAQIDASRYVDVRFGCAYEAFEQDADGVTTTVRNAGSGETQLIRSHFLAGCDGGGSAVRRDAAITLTGQHAVAEAYMVHFRSTAYDVLAKFGISYHLQTARGTIIAQNGKDIWTLQTLAPPDSDPDELLRAFVGRDFEYEILVANPWTPHLVTADSYRSERVFLAGDSAHQVIPTGGYGMNTGVGDAVDLGWKLAAFVNGWGGETLLNSYEAERRPIAEQNAATALQNLEVRLAIADAIAGGEALGDLNTSDLSTVRIEVGRKIAKLGNAENESWGIEHGYRYQPSPVVQPSADLPAFDPVRCPSFAVAGGRLPHYYLADGSALFDRLGREFSLIVIGHQDVDPAVRAAAEMSIPLTTIILQSEEILNNLGARLLLVRPDQHVAWLGTAAPDSWTSIFAMAAGLGQDSNLAAA
nr:FAD-dependent monooxygenase [Sphingobium sp. 15-1]